MPSFNMPADYRQSMGSGILPGEYNGMPSSGWGDATQGVQDFSGAVSGAGGSSLSRIGGGIGSVGDLVGSAGGALLGGLGSIFGFGRKKSEAQKAAERATAVNKANDPRYYERAAINYGNAIGAQENWGMPGARNYYNANPAAMDGFMDAYAQNWRGRVGPGNTPEQRSNQQANRSRIADETYRALAGPKVEQMEPMFGQPQGGFGTGGGNMGNYHLGYGGRLA